MDAPRRGLTLVELAIALAIAAIIGWMAVPTMARQFERHRLLAAAEGLAADIAEARFEAARRGTPLHLQPEPGAPWCWSVAVSAECGCGAARACQLKVVREADHPGVHLLAARAVRLDAEGRASGSVAATLRAGSQRLQVEVSPAGRARVCDPDGGVGRVPRCGA